MRIDPGAPTPQEPTPDDATDFGGDSVLRERLRQYEEFAERHADLIFLRVVRAVPDADRALDVQYDTFLDAVNLLEVGGGPGNASDTDAWLLGVASTHVEGLVSAETDVGQEQMRLARELLATAWLAVSKDDGKTAALLRAPHEVVWRFTPLLLLYFQTECTELNRLAAEAADGFSADLSSRVAGHAGVLNDGGRERSEVRTAADGTRVDSGALAAEVCQACGPMAMQLRRDFGPAVTAVVFADDARSRAVAAVRDTIVDVADAAAPSLAQPRHRRRSLILGLTAMLCAVAVVAAVMLLRNEPSGLQNGVPASASGAASPAASPRNAQDQAASDIRAAMAGRRFAACRFEAREPGDPAWFVGTARIEIGAEEVVNAATRVAYDFGEGHMWFPPDVVLLGDRAYVTPSLPRVEGAATGPPTTIVDPASATYPSDYAVVNALEARALAAPAHIALLLSSASDDVPAVNAKGHQVYSGTARLRDLASDASGAFLYGPYARPPGAESAAVSFVLEVDSGRLPVRLEVTVPVVGSGPGGPTDSFAIEYTEWGQGGPVTAPSGVG